VNDQPAAFDPASQGWVHHSSDAFIEAIGPAWKKPGGTLGAIGILARAMHDNNHGFMHGGALMAFIDHALGLAVAGVENYGKVTIQLDVQFAAAIPVGSFVVARPEVSRRTTTLAFVRGEFLVSDAVVATASGIWRVYPGRA
jgi:acyl-coenzyme A thioesterase PaaI-like protein